MKKTFAITVMLAFFICSISAQYAQRRQPIRKNLDAFKYALDQIEAQHNEALAYRTAISNAYIDIITNCPLSEKTEKQITELKNASIKRIDDMALYGSYSYSLNTAVKEYGAVVPQMRKIANDDLRNQQSKEEKRMYEYTHPFDNKDYSKYTKVINNPTYESKQTTLKITRIAKSNTETRIEFLYSNTIGNTAFGWVCINPKTYLYDPIYKKKYELVYPENIKIAPSKTTFKYANEQLVFALIFPALPANVSQIDLVEPDGSNWIFNNINVK